jgi:hypothetical protein
MEFPFVRFMNGFINAKWNELFFIQRFLEEKKFNPKLAFIDKATLHAQVHDSFIKSEEIGCLFHGFEP